MISEYVEENLIPDFWGGIDIPFFFQIVFTIIEFAILFICFTLDLLLLPIELIIFFIKRSE